MQHDPESQARLQARLAPVITLLNRQRMVEELSRRQSPGRAELVQALAHRQMLADLDKRLEALPPEDVAHLLETLPASQRQTVWEQLPAERAGLVLWELDSSVAPVLVAGTPTERLGRIVRALDADGLAHVARYFPGWLLHELHATLEPRTRSWLVQTASYPEESVGRLMSRELVVVDTAATVRDARRALRRRGGGLPAQLDALFVVDERDRLVGTLPLQALLVHSPRTLVTSLLDEGVVAFGATDDAVGVARAFERYGLLSAPVVDARRRLLGRLTSSTLMHVAGERATQDALRREGLSGDEDLFGPVWASAQRRWLWLGVNLLTAFLASRVIGAFEPSIERLVALATLMPMVASIGGNTGNQTVALFIRGLALERINAGNLRYLARRELGVALVNGLLWGGVLGALTLALYRSAGLAGVIAAATALNLAVAALVGIAVPVAMQRLGRDPALGSSVLLTFSTDSMGFLIFLGLATLFLLR